MATTKFDFNSLMGVSICIGKMWNGYF